VRRPSGLHVAGPGKLGSRVAAAVDAQPGSPGRLGALQCHQSKKLFLVDTGAVFSVIPYKSDAPATGPAITSAAGARIPCWGWRSAAVKFGTQSFTWRFLLAAVSFPLLGADFLRHFKLVVDLSQFCVYKRGGKPIKMVAPPAAGNFSLVGIRPAPVEPTPGSGPGPSSPSAPRHRLSSHGSTPSALLQRTLTAGSTEVVTGMAEVIAAVAPGPYAQLLSKFPDVVCPSGELPPVKHGVQHFIETEGRPVAAKYRRLDPVKLEAAR
jgi:hypothetical protein